MASTPQALNNAMSAKELAQSIAAAVGGSLVPYGDNSFSVRCPAHDDSHPSLSVSYADGRPLVHCHAGCSQQSVISALKQKGVWPKVVRSIPGSNDRSPLSPVDVFSDDPPRPEWIFPRVKFDDKTHAFYTGHWLYRSEDGTIIGAVARYDTSTAKEKSFRPYFRPNASGGFGPGHVAGQAHTLYQLDRLANEPADAPIWITEGEQACSALAELGALSTTSCNGSKSPQKSDWSPLSGRDLIIWPDADQPGIEYATKVHALCEALGAKSIRFVDLQKFSEIQEIDPGWDAADWVRAQGCDLSMVPLTPKAPTHAAPLPAIVKKPAESSSSPDSIFNANSKKPPKSSESGVSSATRFRRSPIFTPVVAPDANAKGQLLPTLATALHEIQRLFPNIAMNDFTNKIIIDDAYEFQEIDTDEIVLALRSHSEVNIPSQIVYRAINLYANRNSYHPVRDYLNALKWDGEPRIDHWLPDIFGCEASEYTMQAGKNFLIGAAARIMEPGIKMDFMLVLYGNQGEGKSTACKVLVGNESWFTSTLADPASKDFYEILSGHWVVELDEMDAFKNGRDSAIKSAISTSTDTYRPPYGRVTTAFPRQCVFIGTTNQPHFLKDASGNRRYWPVTVSEVRLDVLAQNRDQYWAEALHRFRAGESFHEMPESAFQVQESFRNVDPWETLVEQYLRGLMPRDCYPADLVFPPSSVTTLEILKYAIGVLPEKMDRRSETRAGNALRTLCWEPVRVRATGVNEKGVPFTRERRYYPPEDWDAVSR